MQENNVIGSDPMTSITDRKVFVVEPYAPNMEAFIAYQLAKIIHDGFKFRSVAVGDLASDKKLFDYEEIFDLISIDNMLRISTKDDVLICNPSFSHYQLGLRFPGLKIMYIQHFNTYSVLDCRFDHYVCVSRFVQNFIAQTYAIHAPVIPAFIRPDRFPPILPWQQRPMNSVAVLMKTDADRHHLDYLRTLMAARVPELSLNRVLPPRIAQRDLLTQIAGCRILLTLSAAEGFGLVPLEAMAMGCTVIGFDAFGGRDYMLPGENCAVTAYPNIEGVADALTRAVNDPDWAYALAQAGQVSGLSERFSYARFREDWRQEFASALAPRTTAIRPRSEEKPGAAILIADASAAMGKDWGQAAELAAVLRRDYPSMPNGYQIGIDAARALGRTDDARTIIEEALVHLRMTEWVLAEGMWDANGRGALQLAEKRARDLRAVFPDNVGAYQVGLAVARKTERSEDAARILAAALRRFPGQEWILAESSWDAVARGDMQQAAILSARLREGFPQNAGGYQIGCHAARDATRFDDAASILALAKLHLSPEHWMRVEDALITRARGDLDTAISVTAELRRDFPNEAAGYQFGMLFLQQAGLLDEARAVFDEALAHYPNESWPTEYAARLEKSRVDRARGKLLIKLLHNVTLDAALPQPALGPPAASGSGGKVVVILGMHRAGTSLCTRLVQALGVNLGGPLVQAGFDNPDGFQEHREVVECHQALLALLGRGLEASWIVEDMPSEFWESEEVAVISRRLETIVIEQLAGSRGIWAFKDPRTAHFLPMWQRIFAKLDIQPVWIVSVRHPAATARSILARDGTPAGLGELLWLEHYLDIVRQLGPQIGAIYHFEQWFAASTPQLRGLMDLIGTPGADTDAAGQFIKPKLRHAAARKADRFAMTVTGLFYARLLSADPDLSVLQAEATALWQQMHRVATPVV